MLIIYGYLCRHNDDVYNVFESNIIVSKFWLKKKNISTSAIVKLNTSTGCASYFPDLFIV